MSSDVTFRWMAFQDFGDDICRLRHQVYVDEQGFPEDMVTAPYDQHGLHLGAFSEGRLISALSAGVYEPQAAALTGYGLPPANGLVVQLGKRASLPEVRGTSLNEVLAAMLIRSAYEALLPDQIFIVLRDLHRKLSRHYESVFGFQHLTTLENHGEPWTMIIHEDERLLAAYLKVRNTTEWALESGLLMPSLVRFLERDGRVGLLALEKLKGQNLYVAPLALEDELPRLSAQELVLYSEQEARLAAVTFPPAPARLLDLGAGPGLYLSMLSSDSRLFGYELCGIDQMAEMVTYAFEGPPEVSELIRSHCEIHVGNRRIMRSLPRLAAEHGFELVQSFSTRARNTGTGDSPVVSGGEMLLDRITMWSLYAFVGQREELTTRFNAAQEVYFHSNCEMSVCIQTHVYRKE